MTDTDATWNEAVEACAKVADAYFAQSFSAHKAVADRIRALARSAPPSTKQAHTGR